MRLCLVEVEQSSGACPDRRCRVGIPQLALAVVAHAGQAGTAAPDTKRTRLASSPRPRHVSARRSRGPRRPRTPGPASPPVLCGWPVPRAPGAERRASVRSCSQPRTGEKGAPRLSPRLLLLSRRSRRVAIADPAPGHPDRPTREERVGKGRGSELKSPDFRPVIFYALHRDKARLSPTNNPGHGDRCRSRTPIPARPLISPSPPSARLCPAAPV